MLGAINISYSNSSPEEKSSKQKVCSETQRPTLIKSLNKSLKWQQNCVPAEQKMTKTRIKIHAEPCGQTILTSGCNNRLLVLFISRSGRNAGDDLETKWGDEVSFHLPNSEWIEGEPWELDAAWSTLHLQSHKPQNSFITDPHTSRWTR